MWQARECQRDAVEAMVRGNIILVWEPGVGKTYPPLVAAQFVGGKHLFIVPAHLREQWAEQAAVHAPFMRVKILDKLSQKIPAETFDNFDYFFCSYEYASELARWKQLRKRAWGSITIDEGHYLSNMDANRTRAMLGLKAEERMGLVYAAQHVWVLTGTPFTFPNQIYPLISRLFPAALRRDERDGPGYMTEGEWTRKFCVIEATDFGDKIVNAQNIPELRRRLEPCLDKKRLVDVTDMPPLTVDTIPVRGELRSLLDGVDPELVAAHEMIMEVLADDDIPDSEKLQALRDNSAQMAQLRHAIAVTKIKPTVEIVRHELLSGVKKAVVFGWHREPLKEAARRMNAPFIIGGMSKGQLRDAKESFLIGSAPVLFGQVGAIGTGTDGIQHVCHRSLFMEAPWTFRENKQCVHRTYRSGQKMPCHTSYLSLVGSIDEYVAKILRRNAEIVKKALE